MGETPAPVCGPMHSCLSDPDWQVTLHMHSCLSCPDWLITNGMLARVSHISKELKYLLYELVLSTRP